MRRNRLLLCLLLGIAILFYGVPYLNFQGDTKTVLFSAAWSLFALMAIGGNLIALLYGKRISNNKTMNAHSYKQMKQKMRQYS